MTSGHVPFVDELPCSTAMWQLGGLGEYDKGRDLLLTRMVCFISRFTFLLTQAPER